MENHLSGFLNSRSWVAITRARVGGKIEQLIRGFRAGLFLIKGGRLQNRTIPLNKTVAPGDFAPLRENVISRGTIAGEKITKTGQGLHGISRKGRATALLVSPCNHTRSILRRRVGVE